MTAKESFVLLDSSDRNEFDGLFEQIAEMNALISLCLLAIFALSFISSNNKRILHKPIGITTAANEFETLIPAGQKNPFVYSETFTNKNDGGPQLWVNISQKDELGTETIASLVLAVPPSLDDSLQVIVTLRITAHKLMRVKTTVVKTASIQEFGPFRVE